ncbi:hypothetical protein H0H92_006590, partial [Tricholoma furcatifolium]
IFTGDIPFAGVKDARVISIIQAGKCPTRPSSHSKAWTDWGLTNGIWLLMEETWKRSPDNRPPCTKIVERLKIMIPMDTRPMLKTGMLTPQAFRQQMNVSAEMLTVERLNVILNDGSDIDDNAADIEQQPASSIVDAYQQLKPESDLGVTISQHEQLPPVSVGLPSQVDETLAGCPRFRILVAGKSGIGKSSLVKNIFNIDSDKIDISHDRTSGKANINHEYKSPVNPRFILHDSQGFEHGSDENLTKVENFLWIRQKNDLPEKIHAIWLCIETPLTGSRLLQTGDNWVLGLAKKLNIPIIAVFTKYDDLVKQCFKEETATSTEEKLLNAEQKASESFRHSVKQLDSQTESLVELSIPSVKVSVVYKKGQLISLQQSHSPDATSSDSLTNLTNVTRTRLQDVEEKLKVLWVAAQQVNARHKVDVSISEGFKNLGQSSIFEGHILIDCIHRLHDDVLKVWNLNNPMGILSGVRFFSEMIGLVKPLIENQVDDQSFARYVNFRYAGAQPLVPLLRDLEFREATVNYLYDRYQWHPSMGKLLATYLINLVLILHGVFVDILPSDPPRALSKAVFEVVKPYKAACKKETFKLNSEPEFSTHPERVIKQVVKERLPLD